MTKPTTLSFGKFLLMLGDGTSPEVFASPCGLTTKGLNLTADANESVIPDCDDPDAPAVVERTIRSLSSAISGSGILAKESYDDWREFYESAESRNVRIIFTGLGSYQGRYVCTQLNHTGNQGDKVQLAIALSSDGEVAYTPAV